MKREFNRYRLPKMLCVLSLIFIIFTLLIVAVTPPATGYELSIYTAYPWYFWLCFLGSIFLGILVILHDVFRKEKSNLWVFGLAAVFIGNLVFLLLPVLRGYVFFGGAGADIFSHVGLINEIAETGHVFEDNFYPIIHIFSLLISDLLGISVTNILWFIPAFFSLLYILFMVLLARIISKDKQQMLLITAFSLPLIFAGLHVSMFPSFFSFIFIPLLIYLYYKGNYSPRVIELTILIVIFCFFIVFFHPMTTIIAIIIFITFTLYVSTFLLKRIKPYLYQSKITIYQYKPTNIILVLAVSFLVWYTSHAVGLQAIKSIYQGFIYGSQSIAGEYLTILGLANLTILQTIRLLILRYGAIALYIAIALIGLFIVSRKFIFSRKISELEFSYSLQLIASFLTAVLLMVSYFIVANPIRSSRYLIMVATIFNGLILYSYLILNKKIRIKKQLYLYLGKSKKWKIRLNNLPVPFLIIASILFFSSAVSIGSVYPSPSTWEPNQHFTHMNYAGSVWMVENREITTLHSQDYGVNLWRMEHYVNGLIKGGARMMYIPLDTPTHFGYEGNETLSQVFNFTQMYMITTENGRQAVNAFPANVQGKAHQFTEGDFNKLSADITVSKLYENGEVMCWLTR